jgi:hypothetical protein
MDEHVLKNYGSFGDHTCGAFLIPKNLRISLYRTHASINVVASSQLEWEHVSASCRVRTPLWEEMMIVHRLFFEDDEVTLQYCMPPTMHINNHPNVLHLWRPANLEIPHPPLYMV